MLSVRLTLQSFIYILLYKWRDLYGSHKGKKKKSPGEVAIVTFKLEIRIWHLKHSRHLEFGSCYSRWTSSLHLPQELERISGPFGPAEFI